MIQNRFGIFTEPSDAEVATARNKPRLTTLKFSTHSCVVKDVAGPKWTRVKKLHADFQKKFPGSFLAVKYEDNAFQATVTDNDEEKKFVSATFGAEVAIANEAIDIRPDIMGAVIGKKFCNMKKIQDSAPAKCMIYADAKALYVYFTDDTPVNERLMCMAYVRTMIRRRVNWCAVNLVDDSDDASTVCDSESDTSSVSTSVSELSDMWSQYSPTPMDAYD
tara:strand:- start:1760 stop:2419 length:660 start_codon:yes stop_codon:yes gene_type:complete